MAENEQHSGSASSEGRQDAERGALPVAPALVGYTPSLTAAEINERALIIDTETTGRSVTAEIIEVALCTVGGEMICESLVRPSAAVPRAAARIHKLTTEMLTSAPAWDAVWGQIAERLEGRLLIAYNAQFDRRMIELMASRYRLTLPPLRWRCAMQFVKERSRWRRALSLGEACAYYGLPAGTHRAATDVRATAALLRTLL